MIDTGVERISLAGRAAMRGSTVVLVIVALTTTCRSEARRQADLANGDDPIAALAATVESTRYTTPYWLQRADSEPTMFARARQYCESQRVASPPSERVNCGAVAAAVFERSGRTPTPTRPRRDPRDLAR